MELLQAALCVCVWGGAQIAWRGILQAALVGEGGSDCMEVRHAVETGTRAHRPGANTLAMG